MLVYNIGISAVQANQAALQTISNNIANANTPGYHRQQVTLAETSPILQNNLQFGTGVTVASIQRVVNSAADSALTLNLSQSNSTQAKLDVVRSIEGLFTPASGSLTDTVNQFFDNVDALSARPEDGTLRREVISAAQNLAQQISSLNSGLDQLQQQQAARIDETVGRINQIASQIAALNKQIRVQQAAGFEPNTLLDQRDQLVQDLGKLVDISPGSFTSDDGTLVAAGGWLVVTEQPQQLSVARGADGTLQIQIGQRGPVIPVGGQLAGLLAGHNELIPNVRESLQSWTSALVSGVNAIQATGLGLSGPATAVSGFNSISDPHVPLSQAGTLLPIQAGSLFLSVTNTATGERQTHEITIDPSQDSLQDVIARIDALGNVNASLTSSGQVRISGESGYVIDFAGRPDSVLDMSGVTGNAVPAVTGMFSGNQNANWTVTAESAGQIGVTSNLNLRVTDSVTGDVVAVLNVGQGYPANQPIEIAGGLSLTLAAGTLNAGDAFQIQAVTDSDTSGFLTAMGMGGLFQTGDFRSIAVNNALVGDPGRLAAGRTGLSGDATQLNRITQFRHAAILSSGTETIESHLASLTSNTGSAVNSFQTQLDQLQSQYDQIRDQQDSVSGVDPNEELMAMLQYQRAFQANAKFLSTINDALDDLLGILR